MRMHEHMTLGGPEATSRYFNSLLSLIWFMLQCRCETFCFVRFYQPALGRECVCAMEFVAVVK